MANVIITGAANGIGYAIAEAAVKRGDKVGLIDADEGALDKAHSELGGETVMLYCDVTNADAVRNSFNRFAETPDLVVNNAGIVRFGPIIEQSTDDIAATVNVNLMGNFIVSKETALRMVDRGSGGHIVNITSINSRTPGPGAGAYPATKAAINQLTRQMAVELGQHRIRVNAVSPGFIDAGMSQPIYQDDRVRELRSSAVPTGELGTAEDIANAIMFLDSEAGKYINGHELVVDGGVVHSLLAQLPRD